MADNLDGLRAALAGPHAANCPKCWRDELMTEPVKGFRQLSVSLGAGAMPAVREALDHAAANPTHNPVLTVAVADRGQRVYWRCGGDWGSPTAEIPECAAGGDL